MKTNKWKLTKTLQNENNKYNKQQYESKGKRDNKRAHKKEQNNVVITTSVS